MNRTGTIATINLTTKETGALELQPEVARAFLGGRGLAGFLLGRSGVLNPADPAMPVAAFTGPLDTGAPSSDGLVFISVSPLTRTVGDTIIRGDAARRLKRAGFDGFLITGRSETLAGVEISEGTVAVVDASHLRGQSTFETARSLDPSSAATVLSIGPAGEQGVLFAGIGHDSLGTAGRSGLGCSLGQKGLKYIAIIDHSREPAPESQAPRDSVAAIRRLTAASPALTGPCGVSTLGTCALSDLLHARRMMPTDNFRRTHFPPAAQLNGAALARRFPQQAVGCASCEILCNRQQSDTGVMLPDFESLSHFTALIGNEDLEVAVDAIHMTHGLGMDPIATAAAVACHQEIHGVSLRGDRLLDFVADIGSVRGEGARFKHGPLAYAAAVDRAATAMTVKGLPISAVDPRGAVGVALSTAVSTTGGAYSCTALFATEVLRKPVPTDRFSLVGKARMIKIGEDIAAAADALVVCRNRLFAATLEEYAAILSERLDDAVTAGELMQIGDRIVCQEREINANLGISSTDDDLPMRFFTDPGTEGPGFQTRPIDRGAFLDARRRYYRIRGLTADGTPSRETQERLALR